VTVRREKVILELQDNFTAGAARAAAATALLKRELDGLNGGASGSGIDNLGKEVEGLGKKTRKTKEDVDGLGDGLGKTRQKTKEFTLETAIAAERTARLQKALREQAKAAVDAEQGIGRISDEAIKGSKEIDRYSGRLRLLADVAVVLGPAAVVVGAGLAGMGVSAGVAGLALYGLGGALTALNKYQLEPTAANLQTLNQEMSKAGPAGREFVLFLDSLGPKLTDLQMVARAGFLPGLQQGIESLMTRFPEVRQIVSELATELGDLAAKGGEWLAGPGFEQFQSFLAYARSQGPAVADFARALAETLIGIGKAMAPIGQVTLPLLTKLLDVIAAIANSPIGPALMGTITAFTVIGRATSLAEAGMAKFAATSEIAQKNLAAIGKGIEFGGLLVSINLLDKALDGLLDSKVDGSGLSRNLEALADTGKFKGNLDQIAHDVNRVNAAVFQVTDKIGGFLPGDVSGMDDAKKNIKSVDDALAQMVESGNADQAAAAYQKLVASARDLGVSQADIVKEFPQYATAVENAGKATDDYGTAATGAAEDTRTWVQQIADASKAMQDQRSAALGAFDAVTQYGQALKDAHDAAAKGKRGIDANTKAGRENRQALSQLAAAWNNQSDAVRNNSDKFRKARRDFIETATAMGVPTAAARRLARQLLEIPNSKVVKVSAETEQARSALASIIAQAQSVPRVIRTDYIVNQITRISKINAGSAGTQTGNHGTGSDGARVPKTGLPYADRHLYLLADGERVTSNRHGQADKADKALSLINSGALTDSILGLADGGTAGGSRRHPGPTGQLTGLGSWLSISEAGTRISNLTAAQIRHLGKQVDDLSKKNLGRFGKALDKAADATQKRLDAEVQASDSVKGSIRSNLTGDLFGSSGSGSAFSQKFAPGSVGAVNATLKQQIADARATTALEKQLRARGVSGAALQELIEKGGVTALRSFASSSNADLRSYQSLYGQRSAAVGTAANTGASVLGMTAEIRRLTAVAEAISATQKAEAREAKRRHGDNKTDRKKNAKHTGEAAAHGVNKSAGSARGKRR
jgi:hypothetical protein